MAFVIALVRQDADTAFGVDFPDLPGCFSAADQFEDVLPNAIEALALWLEGEPRPAAPSAEAIAARAAAAQADGALLIVVPLPGEAD